VETRYPTREDWLRFLANPDNCEGLIGIAYVGTIADILQLAEECKKSNNPMGLTEFERLHGELRRGRLIAEGILHTLDLDREAILDAGFTGSPYEDDDAMTLWSEVSVTTIRPWRTLRRLVLRPHEYRWWGTEPYRQMEEYFGEEQGRNG